MALNQISQYQKLIISEVIKKYADIVSQFQSIGISLETVSTEWIFTMFAGCVKLDDSLLIWDLFLMFGPHILLKLCAECLIGALLIINKNPGHLSKKSFDWEEIGKEGSVGLKNKIQNVDVRFAWIKMFDQEFLDGEKFYTFLNQKFPR